MVFLPHGEKFWWYVYSFRHNSRTWQIHGHTHIHIQTDTQTPHDGQVWLGLKSGGICRIAAARALWWSSSDELRAIWLKSRRRLLVTRWEHYITLHKSYLECPKSLRTARTLYEIKGVMWEYSYVGKKEKEVNNQWFLWLLHLMWRIYGILKILRSAHVSNASRGESRYFVVANVSKTIHHKKLSYRWQTVRCWFVKLLRYGRTFCQNT